MSDPAFKPVATGVSDLPEPLPRAKGSRLHRFFFRHLPFSLAGVLVLLILLVVDLYFVASSAAFENVVRKRLIAQIETATGGRAEVASFHWRLLNLEAEADGVVIHGLEDPNDAPYAQLQSLRVRMSILGIFTPRVVLRNLEIIRPSLHLIVYPDGSTNQPHPRKPAKGHGSSLDALFNLQAGHIAVEQGLLDYDDRAAVFDYRNRYAPLNFEANDVSLVMVYIPAVRSGPECYQIQIGATDLNLSRDVPRKKTPSVHGTMQATIDLERKSVFLRSLTLTAHDSQTKDHSFQITGDLQDFDHPHWQAKATGDLDMRLLEPITGYPDAPEGLAHLDLIGKGGAGALAIDGRVHVDRGSYIGVGIRAIGINLDAQVHADPKQLLISQIVARLGQGGQISGSVDLEPWIPPASSTIVRPATMESEKAPGSRNVLVKAIVWTIPVNGRVTANFKDVPLDALLDIVSTSNYRRLGMNALVTGPTEATWANGDAQTVSVTAKLGLQPSTQAPAGEAPTTGAIDATYNQRNGAVDLRNLELHLPGSDVVAHGTLGAYPVKSASAINLDFHSHNLSEFDAVLRNLGLTRNGKTGVAALPVALAGQADFQGMWAGSLIKPHISGNLKANNLTLEMPAGQSNPNQPQLVHLDSVEIAGSYSPAQIAIQHAQLLRGKTRIALNGTLDASPGPQPEFDESSVLHAHFDGADVDVADVQPFLAGNKGESLPIEGIFSARMQVDGPLHQLAGSGLVEMDGGKLYGEPFDRLRIQGTIVNQNLMATSATLNMAGGSIAASGNYDFKAKTFLIDGHGAGIDLARVEWIRRHNLDAAGKLQISVSGSGSLDDPHLQADASVNALTLGGQQFGTFQVLAHTASRSLAYEVSTRLEGAELSMHGSTALHGGYQTQAQLEFSRFNIGALLTMAHVTAVSGQSSLAGTVTLSGPLAHPEQLHGEAQIRQLALTIAGVQLQSEGGAHATLSNGRVQIDPLHVTGEDTDVRAQGSVSLQADRQLDLAASGSINLKLAETLDPDLTAAGVTTFKVEAHGPLQHPNLQGSVEFQNGSLSLEDLPNGLSQLHGTLEFNQDRLEVKSLTAMSGGGQLSVTGFLAYQHGIYADLSATGNEVHIRYPLGVTSLANAKLQLQGSQNNLLLSGDVLITRFTTNPDLDLAALAAQANASTQVIAPPDSPSNHVRLDVRILSSPQLSFQNAFAKLAGDVNLHLRGTLASPSLLGRVSITEGSAMIAGTRYDLQRGDITFTNPVRIEPFIDLSATAHVEDYDISLLLNGSLKKPTVTYRSDPPLPEADVVSLLALGHTSNQQRLYTQQQVQANTNPTTDALLGGALNATVSNRIQKLFGAGSVKVDPHYLGAFGNSTSRITVEEQLGRNVTLTYATDVNTTSQQLLQAEVAINRHVSLVVARDESGVFSMVVKTTRRYR